MPSCKRTIMGIMRRQTTSVFFSLLICAILFVERSQGNEVAAMFVMGDSLADAGNNNYLNTTSRADHSPYGETFFHFPTGRFSNGRTVFDFLAKKMKLPFAPPYMQKNASFSRGINFASGGSGLLDSTGSSMNIIPFSHQVEQMVNHSKYLQSTMGKMDSEKYLAKSIFFITIGGNDMGLNYMVNQTFRNTTSPTEFVKLLVTKQRQYLQRLYEIGARKIVVIDMGTVGCTPGVRAAVFKTNKGECVDSANGIAMAYNAALKNLIISLNKNLKGATIVITNIFEFTRNAISNPRRYGYSETRKACCGYGQMNAEGSCNMNNPKLLLCRHPEKYLFWDGTHPTEHHYLLISRQIWHGKSSFIFPTNLKHLTRMSSRVSSSPLFSDI